MNNTNGVNNIMHSTQSNAMNRGLTILLAAILMAGLVSTAAPTLYTDAAGTLTVNTSDDAHCVGFASQEFPSCTSPTTDGLATVSLRSALEYASTTGGASTIDLPPGIYSLSRGDLVAGSKADTSIAIHGTGRPSDTTIQQSQAHRTIFIVDINLTANVVFSLENVTVTGGSEDSTDPDGFGGNGGAILAGGSATAPGNSVTMNNVVFDGNHTSGNSAGGAIDMVGGGDLTISNCAFSANQAGLSGNGSGGAIYFDNGFNPGIVTITSSFFTNNEATGSGGGQGGAVYLAGGSTTTFTLTNNTFTANQGAQEGGVIYLSEGSLTGSLNRIAGNAAPTGSGIYVANNAGSRADMRNNWWGCNAGPGGTGCDSAFPSLNSPIPLSDGQIAFNPWMLINGRALLPAIYYNFKP